jgi:hypothetical protein
MGMCTLDAVQSAGGCQPALTQRRRARRKGARFSLSVTRWRLRVNVEETWQPRESKP